MGKRPKSYPELANGLGISASTAHGYAKAPWFPRRHVDGTWDLDAALRAVAAHRRNEHHVLEVGPELITRALSDDPRDRVAAATELATIYARNTLAGCLASGGDDEDIRSWRGKLAEPASGALRWLAEDLTVRLALPGFRRLPVTDREAAIHAFAGGSETDAFERSPLANL